MFKKVVYDILRWAKQEEKQKILKKLRKILYVWKLKLNKPNYFMDLPKL